MLYISMQKKRFSKKKILGILKSFHAKKRQIERNITDQQLIKVLQDGSIDERSEYEIIITLNGYHVYLSLDLEKIITITSPEIQSSNSKIMTSSLAKEIREKIIESDSSGSHTETTAEKAIEDMTFDEYMKNKF